MGRVGALENVTLTERTVGNLGNSVRIGTDISFFFVYSSKKKTIIYLIARERKISCFRNTSIGNDVQMHPGIYDE